MTVRSAVYLTRSRRQMSLTCSTEISYHTLSLWVRWPLIRELGPLVPITMLRTRHCMTLLVRPPECSRRRHRWRQDTSAFTVKFGRATHTVCLSFGGCFVCVDVFFFHRRWCIFYISIFIFSFMISNLVFHIFIFTLTFYKIFI
jgi:hypothetical protein